MPRSNNNIWWGPPRKFSTLIAERKISWLELFYDLVYVIVISKVTHYLPHHANAAGLFDYMALFAFAFWGWFNGSMYHDLHGSPGIRTRFMTLWQMMAAGALAVTLDSPDESLVSRSTMALMFLQLFITYLWWSVGIYDKVHRKLNRPYTYSYLLVFTMLLLTYFVPLPFKRVLYWLALLLNFFPFILTAFRFRRSKDYELNLSPAMTERLGLFAIIIFGEAIVGVINSMGEIKDWSFGIWMCFGMGILIVFALWWIFFSVIADRECRKGMWSGMSMSFIYIPAFASLGMVGAAFPSLMENCGPGEEHHTHTLQIIFGVSVSVFLICIAAISRYLVFPEEYEQRRKQVQWFIILIGGLNLLLITLFSVLPVFVYLLSVFITLLVVIVVFTRMWFRIELNRLGHG